MSPPGVVAPVDAATLRIGGLSVDPPVVLAPMAGVTNPPFRRLCRRFGAGLYVSEMTSARALVEGSERTWQLAAFDDDERPRSIQLFATEAASTAESVRQLVDRRDVDHVDLNFGCPVRKVTRQGGGAALPYKRRLFADIVGSAVEAARPHGVPVTVKMRVGIDDAHPTHLDAAQLAVDAGVAAVALHARTATQWYSGRADWDEIARLRDTLPAEVPVLGNGDIWSGADAVEMMRRTGCDGVVIGRGCLGKPWLFADLVDAFDGRAPRPAPRFGEVASVMVEHAGLLAAGAGEGHGCRQFRRHAAWYCTGYPVGGEIRRRLSLVSSLDELAEVLGGIDPMLVPAPGSTAAVRGHSQGPQVVSLPDGWLDPLRRDEPVAVRDTGDAHSGG